MSRTPPDETTGLTSELRKWRNSTHTRNNEAAGPLFDRIYNDLVKIATTVNFSKNVDPRELVNQLYVRWGDKASLREWSSRVEFFKTAKAALRNLVIDRYREAHGLENAIPLDDQLAAETADLEFIRFFDAVEAIGKDEGQMYADLLTMKYVSPDTDEDIALKLVISESTVKRYFAKADIELRKRMGFPPKPAKQKKTPISEV